MRGPHREQFVDYKAVAIRYRRWANSWCIIALLESATILMLVFHR